MRPLVFDEMHVGDLAMLREAGYGIWISDPSKDPAVPADVVCARPAILNIEMP